MSESAEGDNGDRVRTYHQRSKHAFGRYAPGPGFMDWATQPDPFRRFQGARLTPLPLQAELRPALYGDLLAPGKISPVPVNAESLGVWLELSLGLAAWKQYGGDRWSLRCNPSSGNLHPTEAYVIASGVEGIENGVHHYAVHEHALELRSRFDPPFQGLLLGFSSIHWREAWKYGERAYRYCQHDLGHALGAAGYAAALLGWRLRVLDEWGDEDIAALLGLDRTEDFSGAERETPDLLIRIDAGVDAPDPDIDELRSLAKSAVWTGKANALSPRHEFDWPAIDDVCAAAEKPRTSGAEDYAGDGRLPDLHPLAFELPAWELIKQRRSAQAFDGATYIPARALFRILDATLPRPGIPPFDAWPWRPRVHLILFAHRVRGMPPGMYLFCRDGEAETALRSALKADFAWQRAEDCPDHLGLFRLLRADGRQAAKALSCHQDIAGDSAFSLGMLAEFEKGLLEGPWVYRRLFWECGLIGQALYLEAEAAGVRGTGIGCFFDDPVHELLGLKDRRFQSLYHFTIGGPVVDDRLQTLPGYWHLNRRSGASAAE